MVDKLDPLYMYRVHTLGGHLHQVCVPFKSLIDFWKHVKELALKDDVLDTFTVSMSSNKVIEVIIDAKAITVVDAPYGKDSIVLSEVNKQIVVERTKNAVKKAKRKASQAKEVLNPGKNAKKRTL